MKLTSSQFIFDDDWAMIQISQHEFSKKWAFFVQLKRNKNWYYGEGKTIAEALEACEKKIELLQAMQKPNQPNKSDENIEDIF